MKGNWGAREQTQLSANDNWDQTLTKLEKEVPISTSGILDKNSTTMFTDLR